MKTFLLGRQSTCRHPKPMDLHNWGRRAWCDDLPALRLTILTQRVTFHEAQHPAAKAMSEGRKTARAARRNTQNWGHKTSRLRLQTRKKLRPYAFWERPNAPSPIMQADGDLRMAKSQQKRSGPVSAPLRGEPRNFCCLTHCECGTRPQARVWSVQSKTLDENRSDSVDRTTALSDEAILRSLPKAHPSLWRGQLRKTF